MADQPVEGPLREQLDALVRTVVTRTNDLNGALTAVAQMGCSTIGGCVSASVTLVEHGEPKTVAFTDGVAPALDQVQYDGRTGPCLEAIRTNTILRIDSLAGDDRWAAFSQAAGERGVRSSLSMPLKVGAQTFGGLNLYGGEEAAFDEDDEQVGSVFAFYAAAVIANVAAYWSAQQLAEHLQRAMQHRAAIEQAKGILMARQRCSADAAFEILRRASQRENRKLRDIAVELVERAAEGT